MLAGCSHPKIQRALFSATLGQGVENLARSVLQDPLRITIGRRGGATADVKQSLLYVGREDGKLLAMRQMITKGIKTPAIVFVQSKERAQQLFHEMIYDGLNVDLIHSDRTKAQREAVIDKFRAGSPQCTASQPPAPSTVHSHSAPCRQVANTLPHVSTLDCYRQSVVLDLH